MLMSRWIALAISLKTGGKKIYYSSGFLCSPYFASLTFRYLWYSSSTGYAVNDNSKKENTILIHWRLFMWNCWLYWSAELILILQGQDFSSLVEYMKISLSTKLISQNLIWSSYFFNSRNYSTAEVECMCEIVKKKKSGVEFLQLGNFYFL